MLTLLIMIEFMLMLVIACRAEALAKAGNRLCAIPRTTSTKDTTAFLDL